MLSPPEPLSTPPTSQTCSTQKAEEPDLREMIRRARQSKLDDATARRLALRRVKEQLEVARGEKLRLDSLASIEQARELWHLQEEKHREQKRLRDEAGTRAGGAYKRPVASQEATESPAKKRLVGVDDRRSR
jgi:hypothetical protein